MTEQNPKQAPLDELTKNVVEAARTGLYAAVGLTDKMVTSVREEVSNQQAAAKARRAKRMEQAESFKDKAEDLKERVENLPEEVRGWPDQLRMRAEAFLEEARAAVNELAKHGREAVCRYQGKAEPAADESTTEDAPSDGPVDDPPVAATEEEGSPTHGGTAIPDEQADGEVTDAPGAGFADGEPMPDVAADVADTSGQEDEHRADNND